MKIISWNVNGVRAVQNKGFAETLASSPSWRDCESIFENMAHNILVMRNSLFY
ncbi:MAG: hypothetical protein ACNA7G_13745 [Methylobacter sp.]